MKKLKKRKYGKINQEKKKYIGKKDILPTRELKLKTM